MEETYKLSLTGEQIEAKLALLEGNNTTVEIKADKATVSTATKSTDSDLTLATKGYVDSQKVSVNNINASAITATTANEGQFLRVVDGVATWATIPSAERATF